MFLYIDVGREITLNVCQRLYVELRKFSDMNARTAEILSFCMYKKVGHNVRKSFIALGINRCPSYIIVRVCMAVLSYIIDSVILIAGEHNLHVCQFLIVTWSFDLD